MGKKSKRKSNNTPPPCYHGCTKKEFNNCGAHSEILEGFTNTKEEEHIKCMKNNKHVLGDPTFGRVLSARIAADSLKGKDDTLLRSRLFLLVHIRYFLIPTYEGKDVGPESEYTTNYNKYCRDITTKRGRIKCIAREIPCHCLDERKIQAQSMDKVATCYGCHEEFSKKKILRCLGCDRVQYCSKECSIKDWPEHKKSCDKHVASSAAATQSRTPGS